MQFLTLLTAFATAAVASPLYTPAATPIPTPGAGGNTTLCGKHQYTPSAYICHNNAVLCPIQNGYALSACGQQCYDARIYSCASGSLQLANNGTGLFPPAGAVPTGGATPIPTPVAGGY
ncbi:Carbohydrate binding septum localized [Neofusicoccum parvum]|nr:Carbohydrate binding septum localized [Neofusicoccum parvum]